MEKLSGIKIRYLGFYESLNTVEGGPLWPFEVGCRFIEKTVSKRSLSKHTTA